MLFNILVELKKQLKIQALTNDIINHTHFYREEINAKQTNMGCQPLQLAGRLQ